MPLPRFAFALVPLALALPYAACSSPSAPPPPPAPADVIFGGAATDAALWALLDAKPVDDPVHAASFDNPKDLSALPGTPIITFAWHDGQSAAMLPAVPVGPMRLLPAPPVGRSFTGALADLLGERSAYADSAPMTGKGYLLAFRTLDTNQALFRVFTSLTSYTPDAAAWGKIATGTWTQLQVVSASFSGDRLVGSPIDGQLVKFCIGTWP